MSVLKPDAIEKNYPRPLGDVVELAATRLGPKRGIEVAFLLKTACDLTDWLPRLDKAKAKALPPLFFVGLSQMLTGCNWLSQPASAKPIEDNSPPQATAPMPTRSPAQLFSLPTPTAFEAITPTVVPTATATPTETASPIFISTIPTQPREKPPATVTPIPTEIPTKVPTVVPTEAPTVILTVDVEKEARQAFSNEMKELATPFNLDLPLNPDKTVNYQEMEKQGVIKVLFDAKGLPSMFVITQGEYAVREDVPQYLENAVNFINKYDPEFMSDQRLARIAVIYYSKPRFDKNGFGSTIVFLSAKASPDEVNWPSNNKYVGILLNRNRILDGNLGDINLEAVVRIIHETANVFGERSAKGATSDKTFAFEMEWLDKHIAPSAPEYPILKRMFEYGRW